MTFEVRNSCLWRDDSLLINIFFYIHDSFVNFISYFIGDSLVLNSKFHEPFHLRDQGGGGGHMVFRRNGGGVQSSSTEFKEETVEKIDCQ